MADTMREKLIELLVNSPGLCTLSGKEEEFAENADWLISNGVTVQQWIPASEPPKDHDEYIVLIKGAKKPTTLWYHPKRKAWEECDSFDSYPVTHWQPMPDPPAEDSDHGEKRG